MSLFLPSPFPHFSFQEEAFRKGFRVVRVLKSEANPLCTWTTPGEYCLIVISSGGGFIGYAETSQELWDFLFESPYEPFLPQRGKTSTQKAGKTISSSKISLTDLEDVLGDLLRDC